MVSLMEHEYETLERDGCPPEAKKSTRPEKCITPGCPNWNDQGDFHGRVCAPCYEFLSKGGNSVYSQAYKNAELEKALRRLCEEHGSKLVKTLLKQIIHKI